MRTGDRYIGCMLAGLHDLVEISELAKNGGPIVLVFAIGGAIISASGAPTKDRVERALFGGLVGAVIGLLIGGSVVAAMS